MRLSEANTTAYTTNNTDESTSVCLSHTPSINSEAHGTLTDQEWIDYANHIDFEFEDPPLEDTAPVWHYVQLLEHYKSFIMDDQGLRTSCTVHLINDFKIDDQKQATRQPGYSAVFAFSITTKSGLSPVACCSVCISKDLVSFFALKNHSDSTISESHIFSCRHTTAVVQQSLADNNFNCSIYNQKLAFQQISTIWGPYAYNLVPGWYLFDVATHPKGRLGVYLSNCYSTFVFATQRQQTGTMRHFCFLCKKYSCHHTQTITHELDASVPDSIQTIRLPARPLDSLLSKAVYPCKLLCN